MVANQSRHTMQFSDLAWESHVPQLPQAWMVGQYLERYKAQYLAGQTNFELNLNSRVIRAAQKDGGWNVVVEAGGKTEASQFDHLLVASGYFGKPIIPAALSEKASIPVIHSSQYRDLKSLLSKGKANGGKILVVGGQMSGVEIAGTIASHLSSEVNAPDLSSIPNIDKYSIHHVTQRPVYVFPLHTALEVWNLPTFCGSIANENHSQCKKRLLSYRWTFPPATAIRGHFLSPIFKDTLLKMRPRYFTASFKQHWAPTRTAFRRYSAQVLTTCRNRRISPLATGTVILSDQALYLSRMAK